MRSAQPSPRPSYEKQRRYQRFLSKGRNITARFFLTDTIELSNISTGGACIITSRTLKPGDNVLLKIPHGKVATPLKCTIIWERVDTAAEPDNGHPAAHHKTGMKFNDLSTETIVHLKDFMRLAGTPYENRLSDEYQPSPLRFRILGNEKAMLNYPISYPVKKISLGGMLVETTSDFQVEERHPMAILLPGDERPIKFLGRIASRIPLAGAFDLGIEFIDLNEYDRSRLGMYIRNFAPAH